MIRTTKLKDTVPHSFVKLPSRGVRRASCFRHFVGHRKVRKFDDQNVCHFYLFILSSAINDVLEIVLRRAYQSSDSEGEDFLRERHEHK